jgi:hypothetical protein
MRGSNKTAAMLSSRVGRFTKQLLQAVNARGVAACVHTQTKTALKNCNTFFINN